MLACKIIPAKSPSSGIGDVYTLEATGAMLGGIVTSLFLIRYFGALHIAFLLSAVNLFSAFFFLKSIKGRQEKVLRRLSFVLICALVFLMLSGKINFLNDKILKLKWGNLNLVKTKDSIYGRVSVTRRDSQFDFFNNGLFLFSSHDPLTAEETVHLPFAFSKNPKRVLLIGGAATQIMDEVLKYPVNAVDYVELDPLIISLSKHFLKNEPFYRLNDSRVNIINEDGRFFIKNTKNKYDIVIINLPNPYTAQINRFYTKEFFKELKKVLTKNAVVGFGVGSSENYLSREQTLFLKSIFDTAKSEFTSVNIAPGDTAHFILTNNDSTITLGSEAIKRSLEINNIKTTYVREYYLASKLSEDRMDYLQRALNNVGNVRKNTDFYPISYFYDMILWSTYFSFRFSKFLMVFTPKLLLGITIFFFISLFFVFLKRRHSQRFQKEVALLALGTTGLSEISFEILIVLAFQIIYGYLYYQIGIIITAFMLGLSFGSMYITRRLERISNPYKTYTVVQWLVFVYPLILLISFKVFSCLPSTKTLNAIGANIFAILPFVAGFIGGVQYPLVNKIYCVQKHFVSKSAGITYSIDLFGSFLGALVLSSFFVPILGIQNTCLLLVALNGISLILLIIGLKVNSASS